MWLYRVNHTLGPLMGLYWRLRLSGAVGAIPRKGPILIVANHASLLDPWLIGMAFPRLIRYLVARSWYDRSPRWRAVFRAFGTEPVRDNDPRATIDAVCDILARGEVAGIFPEGRVSPSGTIQAFRPGYVRIAARTGAPVVPIGLRGNHTTLPRSRRVPRPVKVTVHVGEPLVFPGAPFERRIPRAEKHRFHARVTREVCHLAAQEDRLPHALAAGH